MRKLIVVSDWAADSLYRQEFKSAVSGFLGTDADSPFDFVKSTTSSIHTAFLLSQVAETEERLGRPQHTLLFQGSELKSQKHDFINFLIIRLLSGMYVCGYNSEHSFSLLKDKSDEIFSYDLMAFAGSFKSRDQYARVIAHLLDGMERELELEEAHRSVVPELEGHYVGHVDRFGNIITTVRKNYLKGKYEFGDTVRVSIGGARHDAVLTRSIFEKDVGTLVIAPGSSGPRDDPYLELVVKLGKDHKSAAALFANPWPGDEIAA